jgi:hypothetical protein
MRDYDSNGWCAMDRKPEHLPLAEGWDWYPFTDGTYSTRWIMKGPARQPGTIYRCTSCGMETPKYRAIRVHNGRGSCASQHTEMIA